ncbi:MAG: ATP-binding protein [Candidatus Heimdallarchaeota archaeon]|nr:ATP-binding protein [Candidatus Heimdallarchaeota archaeon]
MSLQLSEPIGVLAEGDISFLKIVCSDIRFEIGEILIIKPPTGKKMYMFRIMNYENILRNIQDLSAIAANFLKNREAYIARVESEKLVKVHGLLMGYSELDADSNTWIFKKPRSLPPHFSEVHRGADCPEALEQLLEKEIGQDLEIGKLLIGTKTLDLPIKIDIESLPMHVQVAGTTGAGKSFFMLTFITSALKNNIVRFIKQEEMKKRVSVFMIDVHDEYMRGLRHEDKRYGLIDIANATIKAGNEVYDSIFADKFYLTRDLSGVSKEMQKYAQPIRIRREDLSVSDITSVMTVTDQMLGYMSMKAVTNEDWVTAIEKESEAEVTSFVKGTISAVKRRLYPITRSSIFTADKYSDLAEIVYNIERGCFYNFSTALLSSSEQFIVITMLARTLLSIRQSLLSSTKWSQFKDQVYQRLPKTIASELLGDNPSSKFSLKELYTAGKDGSDYRMKTIDKLPVIMLTIEEAPSILGAQMSKEGNVFIDISRQGRKFNIGMLLITQNISSMEHIILANTNTELNLMLGNEIEIRQAIINASNNIAGYEHEFKVLSRGEAIFTNSLRNIPLPVKVSNVPLYIENELPFFTNPYQKLNVKKAREKTKAPIL